MDDRSGDLENLKKCIADKKPIDELIKDIKDRQNNMMDELSDLNFSNIKPMKQSNKDWCNWL